jgi:polar amino acid transport system substrate-binding protein
MRDRMGRGLGSSPLRVLAPAVMLVAVLLVALVFVAVELRDSRATTPRPVLVSSGSWAPFVGPDLPDGGPVTELVTEVLRRQGYTPQVDYTSWSFAERQAVTGDTIGVFPLVSSESRRRDMVLSDPLVDFQYVLFYSRAAGTPVVTTAEDLATLRVGRIAGYEYWTELEDAVPEFVEYGTSLEGFRALAAGEIDLLPEGLLSGQAVLAAPELAWDAQGFGYLDGGDPLVQSTQGLHFMMPRSSQAAALMRDFNAGLAELRTTDAYAQIISDLTSGGSGVEVTLAPVAIPGLVQLLQADGTPALLAAQGTRARVLEWPAPFVTAVGAPVDPILVPVKLLNGPAQGRVFSVDARALILESD